MNSKTETEMRCLDPAIIIPISRESTEHFKTGTGSRLRPIFLEKTSPCTTGWKVGEDMAPKVAMLSVETNVFPLYEIEDGLNYTINYSSRNLPVEKYLMIQGRYKYLGLIRLRPSKRRRTWPGPSLRAGLSKERIKGILVNEDGIDHTCWMHF